MHELESDLENSYKTRADKGSLPVGQVCAKVSNFEHPENTGWFFYCLVTIM